ncbi:histone deacetylase 4 isoform X2 [Rhinichthys klamathensis goyatoka]|uniref:histone deacetylase 4 isoform X2 n=1 Tax=Rhinichthys klamathensis goyatoka TaxID=3034132 RepID=UPI0024B59E45|nr:histone deacetylase 4 isoform X2 [Rhinichthys klamathensis goyatoka]
MSQHPHRKLERGRESAQVGKQPFNQPLNKKKSEQSAVASDQVKRILNQHIRKKLIRKSESRDPQQLRASNTPDSYFEEDNPLRRTEVSSSSASESRRSLSPDKRMSHQEPQTYSASSYKGESPLHIGVQNPILLSGCSTAHLQPLSTPVFTFHPHNFLTVPLPEHCVVMSHRPLCKTQSEPSFIHHYTHIHTQTLMVPHPMYHQQRPQDTFQQHAPKKVPVHSLWPVSSGELERDRERAREAVSVSSQAPLDNCCSNTPGELHSKEYWDWQNKKYHRKLERVQSSPDTFEINLPSHLTSPLARNVRSKPKYTTGLVYDSRMLNRVCDCGDISFHREHGNRIRSIWSRLQQCGLRDQCEWVKGRLATFEELLSVHSGQHSFLHSGLLKTKSNSSCSTAALNMAFGSVIELALHVARGELRNGFALVTPSGYHASHSQTNGSCMFNSVAIAAKQLQDRIKVKKILIVDWGLHHDNGTEEIFYTDPNVLYISLHHYDNGSSFYGTGGPSMIGSDKGEGYNVNVAWSGGLSLPMGDAEYLAAFRTVVMPIAHEFSPNVVLVSAGFDAAKGHSDSLGGYMVSAKCFGFLTRKLMELAEGRVVLVLEGGYDLISLCDASQACVSALVGNEPEPLAEEELQRIPCANAIESLETVLRAQSRYWRSASSMLKTVSLSYVKGERRYSAGTEAALVLGGLTMKVPNRSRFPNEPMEHDEDDSM